MCAINIAHQGHLGITKTKSLLRNKCIAKHEQGY